MIPLPVAAVIDACSVGAVNVTRRGAPSRSASGTWTPGASITLTMSPVACHTVTGRELLQLPEADRSRDVRRFYTKSRIYVEGDGVPADVITYQGRHYRAAIAHDYAQNGGVWIVDAVQLEGGP